MGHHLVESNKNHGTFSGRKNPPWWIFQARRRKLAGPPPLWYRPQATEINVLWCDWRRPWKCGATLSHWSSGPFPIDSLVGGLVAIFYVPIYWVSNHPNWRTHIFQRGGPGPPTSSVVISSDHPHPRYPGISLSSVDTWISHWNICYGLKYVLRKWDWGMMTRGFTFSDGVWIGIGDFSSIHFQ